MGIRQAALLVMAAVVGIFIALLVSGELRLLTVRGRSMVPTYEPGDLVVTLRQRSYREGEIAAYREPSSGKLYIHRLVRREGDRWVLRGDGNEWDDSYRPMEGELVGKAIIHIGGLGEWLQRLRSPGPMAGLVCAVLLLGAGSEARRRARRQRQAGATAPFWLPSFLLCGAAFVLVALVLGVPAFIRPTSVQTTDSLSYRQEGRWEYFAPGPGAAYDGAGARTGEPLFLALVREPITVTFRYKLSSAQPLQVQGGDLRMTASIGDAARGGWKRTVEIAPAQEVRGQEAVIVGQLDLPSLLDIARRVRQETGLPERQLVLTLTAEARIDGRLAGQPFNGTFAPSLSFQMDSVQALPVLAPGPGNQDPLSPVATGQVSRQRTEVARLPAPYPPLPVSMARWAAVGLAAVGMLLLASGGITLLRLPAEERQLLFGSEQAVVVASLDDLGLPVVHVHDRRRLMAAARRSGYLLLVEKGSQRVAALADGVLLVASEHAAGASDSQGDGRAVQR